jgi:hypothetical protein
VDIWIVKTLKRVNSRADTEMTLGLFFSQWDFFENFGSRIIVGGRS